MKLKCFLLVCSLITFMSCSDDDEDIFVGNWVLTQLDLECATQPELSQTINASNGCIDLFGDEACIELRIESDGTGRLIFKMNAVENQMDFIYTTNNSTLEICEAMDMDECSTFFIRGDNLIIEDFDEGCDLSYIFSKN